MKMDHYIIPGGALAPSPLDFIFLYVATGTSARCRPDAMNEKFKKVDTHLHGTCMYYRAI